MWERARETEVRESAPSPPCRRAKRPPEGTGRARRLRCRIRPCPTPQPPARADLGRRPVFSGKYARPRRLVAAGLLASAALTVGPLAQSSAAAPPVNPNDFQQITLAKGEPEMGEPMSM